MLPARLILRNWLSYDAIHIDTRGVLRPLALRLLYRACLMASLLSTLFLLLAPLNLGRYYIDDRALTGRAFLREGGWALLLGLLLASLWLLRDLRTGNPRLRLSLLALWALGLLAWRPSAPSAGLMLAEYLALGVLLAWYLYRKSASRAYFAAGGPHDAATSAG